jgi:hypothetical protein
MPNEETPAELLALMRSGKPFTLTPSHQRILEGALARSPGAEIGGDDPPPRSGQPQPPNRLDPKATLFKRGEGEAARRQNVPEAMDDDDIDATVAEIHAMLQANDVPEEVIAEVMPKIVRFAKGVPPGMNKHAVLKDGKIEHYIIGDARPFRDLFASLPRVHAMGSPIPEPRSRPLSAAAVALVATALPGVVKLRRV